MALALMPAAQAAAPDGFLVLMRPDAGAPPDPWEPAGRTETVASAVASAMARALPGAAMSVQPDAVVGRWHRVHLAAGADPAIQAAGLRSLRADPRVQAVVPNVREQRLDRVPADARYAEQWWLQPTGVGSAGVAGFSSAWLQSTGTPVSGTGAVVAVLDSGITSHPELNARLLPGWDFVSNAAYANDGDGRDNDPADPGDWIGAQDRLASPELYGGCPDAPRSSWHGTVIAGQLAAVTDNTEGVAAGNWNGRVVPVRVAGRCGASVADIVDGMRWAAGLAVAGAPLNPNPARIIVLGYGGVDRCDLTSDSPDVAATARLYTDTLDELRRAGTLVIAAAGNQRGAVARPASCAGALAVTSLNRQGFKATYANVGAEVALATPGGDQAANVTCDAELADDGIVSTGNLGATSPAAAGYVAASGTSFAAPGVAAVATLMLAVNPALTVEQLVDGLRRTARPHAAVPLLGECAANENTGRCGCTTATCGAGALDAVEALRFAASPAGWVGPPRAGVTLDSPAIRACAVLLGRPVPPDPEPPAPEPAGGGGGASSLLWMLALGAAAAALRCRREAG